MLNSFNKIRRTQVSKTTSVVAPVGGWNARDALGAMKKEDAAILTNLWPGTSTVYLRNGYTQYAYNLSGQVESLLAYSGGSTTKLFAAAGSRIYDASNGGSVGNALTLPGTAGAYASTPDSAALDITGDIDIIAKMNFHTLPVLEAIVNKATSTTSQVSYRLSILGGHTLFLRWSTNGTSFTNGISLGLGRPFVADLDVWIRFTLDVDNGAGSYICTAYTSDDGTTWTQSDTLTVSGTTSIYAGTAILEVGSADVGTSQLFNGRIYVAKIYSGIGGTLKASFVADDGTAGAGTVTSVLTGEVYTINGAASITSGVSLSSLTNGRWQYTNITTTGGSYIMCVNGADKLRTYDGSAWHKDGDGAPYDITNVDTSTVINITLFKNRIWMIVTGSLKAWYLPINSIGGAAVGLDMSSVVQCGGYLMAAATWTLDAGYGMDDYLVFITSEGEVVVWRLTDPTTPTGISMIGVYQIGSPIGRRCMMKYGGDLLIITQDGLVPMASALQSSRLDPRVSLTDKIQLAMSQAISSYGSTFGWQLCYFPKENQLYMNVPISVGAQQQYVMNTITKNWCNFTGWNANCWEIYNDNIYFGGNGIVGRAWNGLDDAGADIQAFGLQAFEYLTGANTMQCTMMRPHLLTNGTPSIYVNVNADFDLSDNTAQLDFAVTDQALWDYGTWGTSLWGADLVPIADWQGATGMGYCFAPVIKIACQGIQVQWVSTDMVFQQGGTL